MDTPEVSDAVAFLYSPVALEDTVFVVPLGNMNPVSHTLPTDHVYFYWNHPDNWPPGGPTNLPPVYAPAAGTIVWILDQGGDQKVMVQATPSMRYYLSHILLAPGFGAGTYLSAGQVLGTSSSLGSAIDLGVVNDNLTLAGFINPNRYPEDMRRADFPLKYFVEPLRASVYAKVDRTGQDKDGKIDYDQPGKLVGNWFHQSLPADPAESFGPNGWSRHLAFAYSVKDPSDIRISIGGTLSMTGLFAVHEGAPDPASIDVFQGKVAYRLYNGLLPASQMGLLIVQMLDADSIRVQTFTGNQDGTAEFDGDAQIYLR